MLEISPCLAQVRSSDHIYLFKPANAFNRLIVDIFNRSGRFIESREIALDKVVKIQPQDDLKHVVRSLLKENYRVDIREKDLFVVKSCESIDSKSVGKAVITLSSKVAAPEGQEDLICPITCELFRDPVVDIHGHTFEREAIEEYFRREGRRTCPVSRESIDKLTPNLAIKSMVELIRGKSPVPTCDLFEKDNPNLADGFIKQGHLFDKLEEHEEALEVYTKALKYTQKSEHYAPIPPLFEKQGDRERAALSYLYLAQYQMKEKKFKEAEASLKKACDLVPDCIELTDPLAQCHLQTGQIREAAILFSKLGKFYSDRGLRERAIHYHWCKIDADPDYPHSYEALADLYDKSSYQAHVYLCGALHYLDKDPQQAELFCKRARDLYPEDPNTYLPYLELLNEQKRIPELIDLYKDLISLYEKLSTPFEERLFYYKKIVSLCLDQGKQEDALSWYLRWMTVLMDCGEWTQAENVGNQALDRIGPSLKILEQLNTIYQWNIDSKKQRPLLARLGKAYEDEQQFSEAEKTYRISWKLFQDVDAHFSLARIFVKQGNHDEGFAVYKELAGNAFLQEDFSLASRCFREIKQIDPNLARLSQQEKLVFATQQLVLRMNDQLNAAQHEIMSLKEELRSRSLPRIDIGKDDWERHYGEVEEAPLPPNIKRILGSPCPFWNGHRVEDTHSLVLIPKSINGIPLTLNNLEELVQHPRPGGHAAKFTEEYTRLGVRKQCGDEEIDQPYWILITREPVKAHFQQPISGARDTVEQYVHHRAIGLPYTCPTLLEASVRMLFSHAKIKHDYIPCQERFISNPSYRLCVRYFYSNLEFTFSQMASSLFVRRIS